MTVLVTSACDSSTTAALPATPEDSVPETEFLWRTLLGGEIFHDAMFKGSLEIVNGCLVISNSQYKYTPIFPDDIVRSDEDDWRMLVRRNGDAVSVGDYVTLSGYGSNTTPSDVRGPVDNCSGPYWIVGTVD